MGNSASSLGLGLCCVPLLVHGPEIFFPTLSRFVSNLWFPPFIGNLPNQFSPELALNYDEQMEMFNAFLAAAPAEKIVSAKDLLFVMLFEIRQGATGFFAVAATAAYCSTIPLEQRHPVHFMFSVLSLIMAMADSNHGGLTPFGYHPFISNSGWAVGLAFTPFWLASLYCNWVAFGQSRAAAGKSK